MKTPCSFSDVLLAPTVGRSTLKSLSGFSSQQPWYGRTQADVSRKALLTDRGALIVLSPQWSPQRWRAKSNNFRWQKFLGNRMRIDVFEKYGVVVASVS
jgi:hypothetical protein